MKSPMTIPMLGKRSESLFGAHLLRIKKKGHETLILSWLPLCNKRQDCALGKMWDDEEGVARWCMGSIDTAGMYRASDLLYSADAVWMVVAKSTMESDFDSTKAQREGREQGCKDPT